MIELRKNNIFSLTIFDFAHFPAVLRLPFPIPVNPKIQPIALPTDCGAYLWTDDEYVMVVGNGRTSAKTSSNDIDARLQHAFLHTVPNKECAAMTPESVPGSVLCSLPSNGQSAFSGDSGMRTYLHEFSEQQTLNSGVILQVAQLYDIAMVY